VAIDESGAESVESGLEHSAAYQRMKELFESVHKDLPHTFQHLSREKIAGGPIVQGYCDFSVIPPIVAVARGLSERDFIDILIHEYGHLVCGLSEDHGDRWEAECDDLRLRYASVAISNRPED
jgi:hypothetical protein